MPGKDGTGPLGRGRVIGGRSGRRGQRGAIGADPARYCICPKCGEKITHMAGTPCASVKCPKCGAAMIRGS